MSSTSLVYWEAKTFIFPTKFCKIKFIIEERLKKEKVTYSIELNLTIISIETGPEIFLPAAPIKTNIFAGIPEER